MRENTGKSIGIWMYDRQMNRWMNYHKQIDGWTLKQQNWEESGNTNPFGLSFVFCSHPDQEQTWILFHTEQEPCIQKSCESTCIFLRLLFLSLMVCKVFKNIEQFFITGNYLNYFQAFQKDT